MKNEKSLRAEVKLFDAEVKRLRELVRELEAGK